MQQKRVGRGVEIEVGSVMVKDPVTIQARRTLGAAHRLMRRRGIRHLPVLRGRKLVGLVSVHDLHLIETLKDVDPEEVTVEDAMSPDLYQVSPKAPLVEVVRTMAERKLGSVIVVREETVVGLFTTIDGMRLLAGLLERRSS